MKKSLIFPAILLSIMLLSACGKSEELAPTADAPTEQPSLTEETNDDAEEPEKSEEPAPIEYGETDKLRLKFSPDEFDPNFTRKYSFLLELNDDRYHGLGSGVLFSDFDERDVNTPYWMLEIEDKIVEASGGKAYTDIHIEGEIGKEIRDSFDKMFIQSLASDEEFINEKYEEIAKEAADKQLTDKEVVREELGVIDITDSITDKLIFETGDSKTIALPVVSANIYPDIMLRRMKSQEINAPFWEEGEIKYWLGGITIFFEVPKEPLDEIREYLLEQIKKTDTETTDMDDDSESETDDGAPYPIPDGKNFDNVTGFEGYWYDTKSDKLIYVLFSDGTGLEISDIDGTAYDIKYTAKNGMVTISESLDTYFLDIIDENTLRADWDIVRKPYDGSLDKKTDSQKSEKPAGNSVSDITGLWYDPSGYQTGVYNFNGDGTGALYWNGNAGDASSFTYTISGSRVSLSFSNHSEGFTMSGGSLRSDYGDEFVRK